MQPALPLLLNLKKPTSSKPATSAVPQEPKPSQRQSDEAVDSHGTSQSPNIEQQSQKEEPPIPIQSPKVDPEVIEYSAEPRSSSTTADEHRGPLSDAAIEDKTLNGDTVHEVSGSSPVSDPSVTDDAAAANGITSQAEVDHGNHEAFETPASRFSSKELATEDGATETAAEVQISANTSYAEVNGGLTHFVNGEEDSLPQAVSTEEESRHIPATEEGYGSNGHAHTSFSPQQAGEPATGETMLSLADHLLQMSHNKSWSDWAIVVTHKSDNQTFVCYAHSMMLVRSPRLAKMMERQANSAQNSTLTLITPTHVLPHAFEAALRFFYSDTILTAEALFPQEVTPDTRQVRSTILHYILSYWMSGLLLGIYHVSHRASKLLSQFVDWDVLEVLMKEAETLASGIDSETLKSDIDWSDLATQWKNLALTACANKTDPRNVRLDSGAASSLRSRFGVLEDTRGKHNPVLASMVFGSMPSSADMSPSSTQGDTFQQVHSLPDTTLSNILLNADFHDLVYYQLQLEKAWGTAGHQLIADIVSEREHRRQKIVSNQAVPNKVRTVNSTAWDVVGFKEVVVHNGEIKRERVGFLLPASR